MYRQRGWGSAAAAASTAGAPEASAEHEGRIEYVRIAAHITVVAAQLEGPRGGGLQAGQADASQLDRSGGAGGDHLSSRPLLGRRRSRNRPAAEQPVAAQLYEILV